MMNLLRRWRGALLVLTGVPLLAGAAFVGAGWYYSDALKNEALVPDRSTPKPDLQVAAVKDGEITLNTTPETDADGDWTKSGTFGLVWQGGYGQVGEILEIDERRVVREFTPLAGSPRVGDLARLDSFAFPSDPLQAYGVPFTDISVSSPAGDFPAWFIEGSGDAWAIFVHGKGADRKEALRILRVFNRLDIPSLVITYRNDAEAPAGSDGFYRYGKTEWQDLQAAADYALAHGAQSLVLIGYSMGGGIVASFLYQSPLADRVTGVILDAPMLDFEATVDWGARGRFAPWPVKDVGKQIAAWRFDIDWEALSYVESAPKLSVPILLFHGDDDPKVPFSTSDELSEARPDLVTYYRTTGTGHVRSWNTDPATYEAAVREFLARLEAIPGSAGGQ
jgi:pimeloyl-ACP methyl ester carboxylesterase